MSSFEFDGNKYRQASARDTVVEKMIQTTIQPDGTCFETFRRINVSAKK